MVMINLAKVVNANEDEEKRSLLSNAWQSTKARPSRKTLLSFAALVIVLQGLLVFKWYFYDQEVISTPPYDVQETVGLVTAVSFADSSRDRQCFTCHVLARH